MAPIIIFAFNRPDALRNTVESLLRNAEAKESELFVFIDGARPEKEGESDKVKEVVDYVAYIKGFKSVSCQTAEVNKGLGSSVISGVTKVINRYGKAIILEDDLIFAENFLSFMNQGLDKYEKDVKVFSICGYSNKVKVPKDYLYDTYFCTRSSSWGWATWKDRWNSVDWELKDWEKYRPMKIDFNHWGGSDCWKMLNDWKNGKNKSWAIRFCFAQFLQDKVSLFPLKSKVDNEGFDGQGTNCKSWSRFKCEFDISSNKVFTYPPKSTVEQTLFRSAMSYHTVITRLFSRIMYLLYR